MKFHGGEQLEYKDVSIYMPYYLYKGINLKNAKGLINNGVDIGYLKEFLNKKTVSPITKDGRRYFMITTSLDNIETNSVDDFLYKEGTVYTLPQSGAEYFIDTSDHTIYNPGDKIKVQNSIHFKAVYH